MGKNNLDNFLDEGEIKYVDVKYMPIDYVMKYVTDYKENDELLDPIRDWDKIKAQNDEIDSIIKHIENSVECPYKQHELTNKVEKRRPKLPVRPSIPSKWVKMEHYDNLDNTQILRYYGLEPFNRCIMINISPNWKGKCSVVEEKCRGKFIKLVMQKFYENCNRFNMMKYVIECGKDGDFIHVHSVFELNVVRLKSTMSSIRKGNLLRDLRVLWNKTSIELECEYEGLIDKRYALQSTLINTREILKDKLDYLIEENKPESHRNAEHPLYPQVVSVGD